MTLTFQIYSEILLIRDIFKQFSGFICLTSNKILKIEEKKRL